jgi:hypothetical protein
MPTLLNLDTLTELYPDPEGRRQFVRRAMEILHNDRLALQEAVASLAYARAGELAHRLQGTAAFLTSDPEHAAAVLLPLNHAIRQGHMADTLAAQKDVLRYLIALEAAMGQVVDDR